jgi:hypothetical protein
MAIVLPVAAGPPNCYGPNVKETLTRRDRSSPVFSTSRRRARTGGQANHAGPIKARHSMADVCTVGVADWLPIAERSPRHW